MLPDRLLPHSVTVRTAGTTTNRYGDTVQDWTSPTEVTALARIELVMTQDPNEVTTGRDDATSVWRIFTNYPLTMFQRVIWDDRAFDVDGEVAPSYGTTLHHYEAVLKLR